MNDYNRLSSEDIEQEVEQSRANIGSTLKELRSRAKPARLANEALALARTSGGDSLARTIGSAIRDNPIPVVLIGAGIAWLASGRSGGVSGLGNLFGSDSGDEGAYPQRMDLAAAKAYRPPRHDARREEVEAVEEEIADTGDESEELEFEYAEDEYDDTSNLGGEGAGETFSSRTRQAMADAGSKASSRTRELGEKARDAAQRVQEHAKSVADEQPFTLALAGLALGALIGAAVRGTSRESELMGDASDRVKAQAKQKAREGLDEATAAAERTLETVREEMNARVD